MARLKGAIRKEYKTKRHNPDNPLHIPDNETHCRNLTDAFNHLEFTGLPINYLFRELDYEGVPFICIKLDVPKQPKTFPLNYVVGGDLDIIFNPTGVYIVKDIIKNLCHRYRRMSHEIIETKTGIRYRLNRGGKLHYQIDMQSTFYDMSEDDIYEAIRTREGYKPNLQYEMLFRMYDLFANPKKTKKRKYHVQWLKNYEDEMNEQAMSLWHSIST
jgi:hypothetical protein